MTLGIPVTTNESDQPLLIFYDATQKLARAAALPANFKYTDSIRFNGRLFHSTGTGIVFWDYLVSPDDALVGIVLNKFEIADALSNSALLTASENIDSDEYGYYLRLHESAHSADMDSSQAFESMVYERDGECLLYLVDWHRRGYRFEIDTRQTISAG